MSWRWPSLPQYQTEIAAYVRFDFHTFTSDLSKRSQDIQTFWHSSNYVELPLPTRIGTDLNMDYTTNSSRISSDRNFAPIYNNPLDPTLGTLFEPLRGDYNIRMPGRLFADGIDQPAQSNGSPVTSFLDIIDTTWLGQSRRVYSFDFNMICKSLDDSGRAASICNFMNAAALPSLKEMSKKSIVGNQKAWHPAMCTVHVFDNSGGIDEDTSTRYWLGEFPQLCVLQKVKGTRVGGDGNQIIGMQNGNSGFVPTIYNLKLMLVELEPVYTDGGNTIAKARSQFFTGS
jgi:hypothetical protein